MAINGECYNQNNVLFASRSVQWLIYLTNIGYNLNYIVYLATPVGLSIPL